MKINAVRAMLIVSLVIILLYILGLFLPIIKNTKNSRIFDNNLSTFGIFVSIPHKAFHKYVFLRRDLKYRHPFYELLHETI